MANVPSTSASTMPQRKPTAIRAWRAMATITLALACGNLGHAAGVFLPAGPAAPASQTARAEAGEVRESRFVRIAHSELQRVRTEVGKFGRSRLLFNMSGHLEFDAAIERTEETLEGYTLSGQIDRGKGGFVTLTVHPGAVAGSISTWGASYEVMPVAGGLHAIRRTAPSAASCGGVVPTQSPEHPAPLVTKSVGTDDTVIDILVFWTPAREEESGRAAFVKSQIDQHIAYTNDALGRSGALVRLNLVGAERLDVEETSEGDIFDALLGAQATQRAEELGADFLHMETTAKFRGIADGYSLSISNYESFVFAHEIGHNLCLAHDRSALRISLEGYGGGYNLLQLIEPIVVCGSTIMSYSGACAEANGRGGYIIPYYASPSRYDPLTGRPAGVSRMSERRGWDGAADAILAINRCRHSRSNIRPRRVPQ